MDNVSFGEWLKRQRKARGWTQKELAQAIPCSVSALRKMEAEERRPSAQTIARLAEIFEIPQIERRSFLRFARGDWQAGTSQENQDLIWEIPQAPRTNLPKSLTSFIGREKEKKEIKDLLVKYRLVTLAGAGGIGKTRLALQVAEPLLNENQNGVWFVAFDSLSDSSLVTQTIASIFDIRDGSSDRPLLERLTYFLYSKKAILILDNCEHLLQGCAQLIVTLLTSCPTLKILVTSREPLGITGEALYRVPSLRLPNVQDSPDSFRDFESVQLFEERAQLTQLDFSLTLENAASIAQICQRLDGIPLAIELAAAKINMFSAEQIANQLHESFNLLSRGSRHALPRHQTLQATIDWSFNLLTPNEKVLAGRLSVFLGGWTIDAAVSVCSDELLQGEEVLNLLEHLINKSLVIREEAGYEGRYRFHETIRQYMQEKLVEASEEQVVRTRHLKYFLKLSEQIEPELVGPQQMKWMARVNFERNNIRTALEHAIKTDVEAGLYITSRLGHFWTDFDIQETTRWLTEFLQKPESLGYLHARAKALSAKSRFVFDSDQNNEAYTSAEEALALFRAVGDQSGEVDSLVIIAGIFMVGSKANPARGVEIAREALVLAQSLGDIKKQADALNILAWDHRDFKRAFSYWEESITLYRQVGHWRRLARGLSQFGFFLLMDGQLDAAHKCINEADSLFQRLNIKERSGLLAGLGQIALMRGNYEQARVHFQEDAKISTETGNRLDYLWAKSRLGFVELLAGNNTEARQIFTETVQSFMKDGNQNGVVFILEGMSSLYSTIDKADVATRLIGWCDKTREKIGDSRPKLEQADVDKTMAACIAKLGETAFYKAYGEGQKLTMEEAVSYALEENP